MMSGFSLVEDMAASPLVGFLTPQRGADSIPASGPGTRAAQEGIPMQSITIDRSKPLRDEV